MFHGEICQECYSNAPLHHDLNLCENCYRALFESLPKSVEEPDFELKHDVAQFNMDKDITFVADGALSVFGASIELPKRYVFDHDCRVKDYEKLVVFLLDNIHIYENAKGFDKVKYMFKEADKQ